LPTDLTCGKKQKDRRCSKDSEEETDGKIVKLTVKVGQRKRSVMEKTRVHEVRGQLEETRQEGWICVVHDNIMRTAKSVSTQEHVS
jgi:hypothetical protein